MISAIALLSDDRNIPTGNESNTDSPNAELNILLDDLSEEVLLCTNEAKMIYDHAMPIEELKSTRAPYQAFTHTYNLRGNSGVFYLSEHEDLHNAKEIEMPADSTKLTIDNLKTNTQYYYKVVVGDQEYPGTFKTAASTRFVNIPGVYNTRDIGGYLNEDGKWIKQGLLIRGTEYDGLVEVGCHLADEDVRHSFYDSPMYGGIFGSDRIVVVRKIFADLAKPDNYPTYLHCTYGTDRTGTIIYLLQSVLNMSEEDMETEYKLTAFFNPSLATSDNISVIARGLQGYDGDTIQEKIVSYLTDTVGVTNSEIESIRSIFIEGYGK